MNDGPRRCLVTGAASGIGRATAELLVAAGARVALGDIDEAAGVEVVESLRKDGLTPTFHRVDVSRDSSMEAFIDSAVGSLGGLDAIVNVAGIQRAGLVEHCSESDWDEQMAVNAKSCFLSAKYGVKHLRASGGGVIVMTSSLGALKGASGMAAYCASKGAIAALTRTLAVELAPDSIRVNCIAPGYTDTPFNNPLIAQMGGVEELEAFVGGSVPLGRQSSPAEIARHIEFLVGDGSSYMTGQTLVVDGGLSS